MNNKSESKLIKQKQQELVEKQATEQDLANKRHQMEREFYHVQSVLETIKPKSIKQTLRTAGAYILGRRNRKQLYSKTYKKKQAENDLKPYLNNLYNEGFIEEALNDLQGIFKETNNRYLRQAIAWELALWFANKQTESGAYQAISYLKEVKIKEKNLNKLRQIAILEAEIQVTLGEREKAYALLLAHLNREVHPDLYLALANTEDNMNEKLNWINQMYADYGMSPISVKDTQHDYDAIQMKEEVQHVEGPKISVILPAYNAEEGIQIAIESILGQSWRNIELLIVDDCSPDNTMKVIESYAVEDERIKVFSTKQNSGPYVARNIALENATGDFVTVNDADDWSHSDKLRIQAEHLCKNESILATTSEQARLTESLQFYRRGNPGKYIFSNMSSLMFRREEVMAKLGYWDTVRFAADGEFVRRFINQFGEAAIAHLPSGPLSFPRQSDASLTSSTAFGYSGFFMGVRKEYVESFSTYHAMANELYYPKEQTTRLFPVPTPMLPTYKKAEEHYDVIMMLDIHDQTEESLALLEKELHKSKDLGLKIAIAQNTHYNVESKIRHGSKITREIRLLMKRCNTNMIVYGETVTCSILIIRTPKIMQDRSIYMASIKPTTCFILIDELEEMGYNGKMIKAYNFRMCMQQIMLQFDKKGRWYPLNENVREQLTTTYAHETRSLYIALDNWTDETEKHEEKYALRLKDWIF